MKLTIISANPSLPSNQLLLQAATARGWDWAFHSPTENEITKLPDVALLRLGLEGLEEGIALGKNLLEKNIRVVNSPQAIERAKNKWMNYQIFEKQNLPTVPTLKFSPQDNWEEVSSAPFLHFPLILKTIYGSQGVGVHSIKSTDELREKSAKFHQKGYPVLIQPFLKVKKDLRIFVIGNEVVACVNRHPPPGDFRSNWHRGGQLEKYQPAKDVQDLALQAAAHSLGLEIAGIDILETDDGPFLLEANDSPGLEGITKTCEINFADKLLDYLTLKAS